MVDPATGTAPFGDGGDSRVRLQFDRRGPAQAIGTEDHQEAGTAYGAGAGKAVEQIVFRVLSQGGGNTAVELVDGADEATQLDDGSFDDETVGFDDGGIGRQRTGCRDLLQTFGDDGSFAAIMTAGARKQPF